MKQTVLFIVLSLVMAVAEAKDFKQQFASYGIGSGSCQDYLDARADGGEIESQTIEWLAGYISAFNLIVSDTYDIYGSTDFPGMLTWLDDHCKKFPRSVFVNTVARFTEIVHPYRVVYKPGTDLSQPPPTTGQPEDKQEK